MSTMNYQKKLGVFVKVPTPGRVKTRLVPPLSEDEACELYWSFLEDLFTRLERFKKIHGTVFYSDGDPDPLREVVPDRFALVAQTGDTLGDRLRGAFEHLLGEGSGPAVIIGSDSPDIPAPFLKRAFQRLKHRPVVIGPAFDGGFYLIGLTRVIDDLFRGVHWGTDAVFRETLENVRNLELSCSVLPPWYDVDDPGSLKLLESFTLARRIQRGDRLKNTERMLERLGS